MHIWGLTIFSNVLETNCCSYLAQVTAIITYSTVIRYEYYRKTLMSTIALIQACIASQNDAVYKEVALMFAMK